MPRLALRRDGVPARCHGLVDKHRHRSRILEAAARRAGDINDGVDLSAVRVGLHDEIFQDLQPVLAGVDAASTYCYVLAGEAHRDGDTWGVHLLEAKAQGLNPDYTIADAGQGVGFPSICHF